jgi:acyl CoA:acetate/3-ketoacid CoA transferase alpha subunit
VTAVFTDLDGLVDLIPDGATVAMPRESAGGCAMALVRRAIQRGVRGLHLVGDHGPGIAVDLWTRAGCADTVDPAGGPRSSRMADVAVFHVGMVDRHGNVRIDGMPHLWDLARSAESVVVSYEECTNKDLMADVSTAADTIPAGQVTALAEAPRGSWPLGLHGYYDADEDHLALFAQSAATEDGFQGYLRNHVYQRLAVD